MIRTATPLMILGLGVSLSAHAINPSKIGKVRAVAQASDVSHLDLTKHVMKKVLPKAYFEVTEALPMGRVMDTMPSMRIARKHNENILRGTPDYHPAADLGPLGETQLMKMTEEEYMAFKADLYVEVPKDAYRRSLEGIVYYNENLPFEMLPLGISTQKSGVRDQIWAEIHTRALQGRSYTPQWVYELAEQAHELRGRLSSHEIEFKRLMMAEDEAELVKVERKALEERSPLQAKVTYLRGQIADQQKRIEKMEEARRPLKELPAGKQRAQVMEVVDLLTEYELQVRLHAIEKVTKNPSFDRIRIQVSEALEKAQQQIVSGVAADKSRDLGK